jgi:hypothetical protein
MTEFTALVLTIAGINIALFGALATLIIWTVNKLDDDIKSANTKYESICSKLDGHAQRIDQIYKTILDLMRGGLR